MKKILFTTGLAILLSYTAMAQDSTKRGNNFQLGYNLNNYQNDFGVGIHALSPSFANNILRIKAGYSVQWLQNIPKNKQNYTWTYYSNAIVAVHTQFPIQATGFTAYSEGGFVGLFPNKDFSSKSFKLGGYGVFGIEYAVGGNVSYFLEMGGIGTGAVADKSAGKPIYSNGFLTSCGFRISFYNK